MKSFFPFKNNVNVVILVKLNRDAVDDVAVAITRISYTAC